MWNLLQSLAQLDHSDQLSRTTSIHTPPRWYTLKHTRKALLNIEQVIGKTEKPTSHLLQHFLCRLEFKRRFFFSYRFHRSRRFDKPVLQKKSCLFKGGHKNLGLDEDNLDLKKRDSDSLEEDVQSSDGKEPVYCEIPEQKETVYINSNVVAADSKSLYQELNIANRTSNTIYGKIISSSRPYEVNLAESQV